MQKNKLCLACNGFIRASSGIFGVLAVGTIMFTISVPPQTISAPPAIAPETQAKFLVRGYIATAIRIGESDERVPPRDVYLPGVKVFLKDVATGNDSESVTTDLSGRFTLLAHAPGRYRVCFKAPGFVDDCSKAIYSVSNAHVFVDTLHIAPDRNQKTSLVFGQVKMKDGSLPRAFDPLANVNVFARVSLLDKKDKVLQEVFVNNFGEYLLPVVPVKQAVVLRAHIEGTTKDQHILPEAKLEKALFHSIDLMIGNTPPRLEPIVAVDTTGRRVKVARPGDQVNLEARCSDADNDPLKYKWVVSDGSGTLNATDGTKVTWTLPGQAGRYSVRLLAYDGKGGYAQSNLSLAADNLGIPFSGRVTDTAGAAVAGAEVEVNGQTALTGTQGYFLHRVKDARRFVLNIRKPGYALLSRIYDNSITGGRWTMARAQLQSLDPTRDATLIHRRNERDCPGPLSSRVNWKDFPHLNPQWQDGKGNIVAPFGKLDIPLPAQQPHDGKCGPGIQVKIPANALQDARSNAPAGNVEVSLFTVDLTSPEQMPGDYTVKEPDGSTPVMQSYGAGIIEITAGGTRYNLKPGVTAEVTIPVDRSQLAAGGSLPPTIPLLYYNERDGVWVREGDATLQGKAYVAKVKHFSAINADTLKVNQSCVRVLSSALPAQYNLEVTIPQGGGAAPKVKTELINNSPPSEHVIYNLPSNTNVVLVPLRIPENTPIGVFVVNTGGQQNPTTPNLPVGPPYHACSTQVILTEQTFPQVPVAGEFLHGLFSFEATNLDELQPGDPAQSALKQALDQATVNYYKQVDPVDALHPNGRRSTLADFKTTNAFGGPGELRTIYANSGDLGFGRDMHCVRNGANVAAYVTNYGDITTDDTADVIAAIAGANPVATVAMEYSPIEGDSSGVPVVKFYVYNADGSQLLRSANLDGHGARPIPQLCMVCHGGEYPNGPVTGTAPPFNSADDVKLGSQFIPFDLHFFTFGPPPHDKATQQPTFKSMNESIVKGTPPNAVIDEIITKWYAGGSNQDETMVAAGWRDPANLLKEKTYQVVVARACRTCHSTNAFPAIRFDQASQLIDRLGSVENRVCVQHVMPHAQRTHDLFWTSVESPNPHLPAQLQVFGDAFKTALNGWNGGKCGQFTSGGPTPISEYTTRIQPIWDGVPPSTNTNACTNCHIGATPPQGLNLAAGTSYTNLFNVNANQLPSMKRITPNNPANSYLFHKVNGTQVTVGGSGQRMPLGGPPLSATDISTIQTWINDGAPGP